MSHYNTHDTVLLIKRLAAEHQAGQGYDDIKLKVNNALKDMADSIGNEPSKRIRLWGELHYMLAHSLTSTADVRWIRLMCFSITRAGIYSKNAVTSKSRLNLILHVQLASTYR